jgi:hypothetical protein
VPVDADWSDVTSKSLLLIIATWLGTSDIRLARTLWGNRSYQTIKILGLFLF